MIDMFDVLMILAGIYGVGVLICYVYMTVVLFRRKEQAFGVLCLICLLLGGGGLALGLPVAIAVGWWKARSWGKLPLMIVWTVLVLLMVFTVLLAFILLWLRII